MLPGVGTLNYSTSSCDFMQKVFNSFSDRIDWCQNGSVDCHDVLFFYVPVRPPCRTDCMWGFIQGGVQTAGGHQVLSSHAPSQQEVGSLKHFPGKNQQPADPWLCRVDWSTEPRHRSPPSSPKYQIETEMLPPANPFCSVCARLSTEDWLSVF